MNTENTDENILRYLKFIMISGDARTQKNVIGLLKNNLCSGAAWTLLSSIQVVPFFSRALAMNKYFPICLLKFYS